MPSADKYVASRFSSSANKAAVRTKALSALEAANLSVALQKDALDLYYSSWVSFLDALNGIKNGFCTWSTAKLYYSVFYSFRASLALDDICFFHVSRAHFIIRAKPGELAQSSTESGTHKTVLKAFQRRNPGHTLVSQQIDLTDAMDWLMAKRESANYGDPRFSEPDSRSELRFITEMGIRKTLAAYIADSSGMYVFDPDHAMVAYPLKSLQMVGDQFMVNGIAVDFAEDEQKFLKSCLKDRSGLLTVLSTEMKRLNLVS